MKSYSLLSSILFILLPSFCFAQQNFKQNYQFVKGESYVQTKNFYLLTLLEQIPEVNKIILENEVLSSIANQKIDLLKNSFSICRHDALCFSNDIWFSQEEIQLISHTLKDLYRKYPVFHSLVRDHLLASGTYQLYASKDLSEMLAQAWEQDARNINHTIQVYARGEKPNYPKIDSLAEPVYSKSFLANIEALNHVVLANINKHNLFFQPSMIYALRAVELNGMEQAADYEPMSTGINQAAFNQVKKIDWKKYSYSTILVPGAGPDNSWDSISAGGVIRCRLAATQYENGIAPFIIVSGGNVHPYKTRFNEAIEMRKYLIKLGIPENAIIVEPHARHTTTNMRNAARLIFRYGIPMEHPAITVSTPSQVDYIYAETMQKRCLKELGYLPYKNGKRVSETMAEFYPLYSALQIDEDEPLDP